MRLDILRCAFHRASALIAIFGVVGWIGVSAYAQGSLSGSNAFTISLSSFDLSTLNISDSVSITYRINRLSISARSGFSKTGLTTQSFRLSAPFGDLNLGGGMSFSPTQADAFTRANIDLAGSWEGVSYRMSSLMVNPQSLQSPSCGFGNTFRFSGTVPDLGRLTVIVGLGATPFGSVQAGYRFEGMRISWSNLSFCNGIAGLDFLFGCTGLDYENITWSVPIPGTEFSFRLNLRLSGFTGPPGDWFDLERLTASVTGEIMGLSLNGTFSFDSIQTFSRGVWSIRGPCFGGTLSSTTTFDKTTLLSQAFSWSYQTDNGFSVTVTPTFQILSVDGFRLDFDIPSVMVALRWDLLCCDAIDVDIGDLTLNFGVGAQGIERLGFTYSYAFSGFHPSL